MPRLRRPGLPRRHAPRQRTVTRAMLEYLACGRNFLHGDVLVRCLGDGFGPDPDRDEMCAIWKQCRDELLAAARPGERPWGWWVFDAPGPRQIVKMVQELHEPCASLAGSYGIPFDDLDGLGIYESQADYLDRLGLLTDEEQTALYVR